MPKTMRSSVVLVVLGLLPAVVRAEDSAPAVSLEVAGTTSATLYQQLAEGAVRPVCQIPCRVLVPPGRYVVKDPFHESSPIFELTGRNRRVKADAHLGDEDQRIRGFLVAYAGVTVAGIGLFLEPYGPNDNSDVAPAKQSTARWLAPALMTAGLAALIGGIVLLRQGQASLDLGAVP